jgi:hypothetical protein
MEPELEIASTSRSAPLGKVLRNVRSRVVDARERGVSLR